MTLRVDPPILSTGSTLADFHTVKQGWAKEAFYFVECHGFTSRERYSQYMDMNASLFVNHEHYSNKLLIHCVTNPLKDKIQSSMRDQPKARQSSVKTVLFM
jgi:hypothetical protein